MNRAQGQITEGEELVQICAQAMPSLLSGASGLIVERNEGATLAISCEPVSWSNWLFITSEIALPKMLDYFVVGPFAAGFTVVEANSAFNNQGMVLTVNCRPLVQDCNMP